MTKYKLPKTRGSEESFIPHFDLLLMNTFRLGPNQSFRGLLNTWKVD